MNELEDFIYSNLTLIVIAELSQKFATDCI